MTQYLDLCNTVIRHFNDVELDSSSFSSAIGFHAYVKDAVNNSLREIYEGETEWPFNFDTWTETLVPLQANYAFPSDATRIDFHTFRILRDDSIPVSATPLPYMEYDDYMRQQWSIDVSDDIGSVPSKVFRYQDLEWGVTNRPDKPYQVAFEYWKFPLDLVNYNDQPTLPDRFSFIAVRGAIGQCYAFRQNPTFAASWDDKFQKGIKLMRTQLINRFNYMMDTRP